MKLIITFNFILAFLNALFTGIDLAEGLYGMAAFNLFACLLCANACHSHSK